MFKLKTKSISFLLVLCLVVSLFACIGVSSFAAGSATNTGTRHELCTELSAQAEAYYKGEYSWDSMSALDGVDTNSSLAAMNGELYGELQELMSRTMTSSVSYKSLTSYWQDTDASDGSKDAVLFYSDTVSSNYNREHVWPKSRGGFYQKNAGSDLHHLRPTDSTINSTRGNHTMGDVVGVLSSYSTAYYGGEAVLYYNASLDLVEVNDDIKGDVARILLYVYVRWGQPNLCEDVSKANLPAFDSDDSENNGQAVIEDLDTLLEWCAEDPVDEWEMCRNDCVQSIQGNRNVFIDYPEYAWLLFGRDIPDDMDTPSGEGESAVHYNISAAVNNSAYGSASITGHTVNAVPKTGYVVAGAEVSPAGSAVLTRNGNSFTVSEMKSDCTVTVIFEKAKQVTLTFFAPCKIAPVNVLAGSSVTLPTCTADINGHEFVGWAELEVSQTTVRPVYYEAGSRYTVNADTVLFALYSETIHGVGTGGGGNAELVTSSPADWSGKYVIGVSSKGIMMTSDNPGKTFLEYEDADFSGNSITNAQGDNIFTLKKVGNYYSIQSSDGAYLKCSAAKSISLDSAKTSVSSSDTAYLWSIGVGSIAPATASFGKLQYNASAPRFTTYTSSQTAIGLYRVGAADIIHYETMGEDSASIVDTQVTKPTCTEKGYTTYFMSDGSSYVSDYVSALGHDYGEWKPVRNATCTANGEEARYCSRCDVYETRSVAAHGHSFEDGICTECGYADNPFTDVYEGTAYFEAILWAYHHEPKQITSGFTATEFRPAENCNRGQVVTFLWRAAGEPQPESNDCPFVDVSENSPYRTAIIWAAENGITKGLDSTHFAPTQSVTRAQFVTFLWRYCDSPAPESTDNPFVDVNENSVFYPAILWAADNGITNGYGNNDFRPDMVCTRWHVVLFLQRAVE